MATSLARGQASIRRTLGKRHQTTKEKSMSYNRANELQKIAKDFGLTKLCTVGGRVDVKAS